VLRGENNAKVQVDDNLGNRTVQSWKFFSASTPNISRQIPAPNASFELGEELEVSAILEDSESNLDVASIRAGFDTTDVTETLVIEKITPRKVKIRYVLPINMSNDRHNFGVTIANTDNSAEYFEWSFNLNTRRTYTLIFSPSMPTITANRDITVKINAGSNVNILNTVQINGKDAVFVRKQDGLSTFLMDVILIPGSNNILAKVVFSDGEIREIEHVIQYDAAPTIRVTSPADFQTFGPAQAPPNSTPSGNASNLTGTVDRPIVVAGTASKAVSAVTINQQAATLSSDGKSFSFNNFFLHEGTNLLSVVATDSTGRTALSSITVYVDQTAPILTIENPVVNAVTSASSIDIRGIVNDAVEGGVGAAEAVVKIKNSANNQEVTAQVSDRYYFGTDLPLEVGANDITVTATDGLGNARTKPLRVSRIAVGSKRITILDGNRQLGPVKTELGKALQISATDAAGNPLVNVPIRFDIVRGNGSIRKVHDQVIKPDGINPARNLVVATDSTGLARVWLNLGSEASPGGNSVRAWSESIAEDAVFTATATRGAPFYILLEGGSSTQFVQTESPPVDALMASVYDQDFNRLIGATVRYKIIEGEANFSAASSPTGTVAPDGQSMTVITDKNGIASARPIMGQMPGTVRIMAEAVLSPTSVAGQALFQLIVLERKTGPTQFSGIVMDHTGKPLSGVRLSISRTSLSVTSNAQGKFIFTDQVPPGKIDLFVDGRDAPAAANQQYPALHFETAIIQGQINQLPHPIYLPPIKLSANQTVGGNQDVTLTIPGYEGFELIVKANSVTFPDGSHVGPLVVSPVNNDRLPMVPPGGSPSFGTLGWTIQPTGTRFDPPAQVKIPNPGKMEAGETVQIVQWDHDLATFVPMGRGTVSEDRTQIVTDVGSGISKAGWGGCVGPDCPPDLWDFDYTGTSTILFGAPNEFIVAGAKLQAGFLGNKNPVGAIYLNKFLLPAVNIPSVTFCLDIRCVRGNAINLRSLLLGH